MEALPTRVSKHHNSNDGRCLSGYTAFPVDRFMLEDTPERASKHNPVKVLLK